MAATPEIAVVGAGIFVQTEYIPRLAEISDLLTLKYIWSRTEESSRAAVEIAKQHFPGVESKWGEQGLNDIIQDASLLAVAVVLASQAQVDISLKLLKGGKHVIQVEFCHMVANFIDTSLKGTTDIETALANYNSICTHPGQPIWAVAENYRFEQAFVESKKLMAEDMINVQVLFEGYMNSSSPFFSSSWRRNIEGGFIFDAGVHFIAGLRMMVGCEVTSVSAITSHIDTSLPPPDILSSTFKLENGCSGVFAMALPSNTLKVTWRVVGLKGTIQVELGVHDRKYGYLVISDIMFFIKC
ncbi:hypothetical protein CCACVL1_17866 [Corchorus capsularis]|uniref:Gfo/Idh/MocA-like oxidoreductase N-terminal domain-containing protein n=1 Tax=Corchorus capsularis TaxID=210143 RepID=A0A1R3HPG5_COCAP|nr:hypothetical protein CCACVL1_17866 [Corchorus capsularis]